MHDPNIDQACGLPYLLRNNEGKNKLCNVFNVRVRLHQHTGSYFFRKKYKVCHVPTILHSRIYGFSWRTGLTTTWLCYQQMYTCSTEANKFMLNRVPHNAEYNNAFQHYNTVKYMLPTEYVTFAFC